MSNAHKQMPEPMIPATAKGAAMRERLLTAAGAVFGRKGYESTRVEDIVRAAKTSYGNFYRHFRNKDEVLLAVLQPLVDELYFASKRGDGSSFRATEAEFVENTIAYLKAYARHRKLLRLMREAAARGEKSTFFALYQSERSRFLRRTATWLTRLQSLGEIDKELEPETAAEALGGMMEQIAYIKLDLAARAPSGEEIELIATHCAKIWYRGVFGAPQPNAGAGSARVENSSTRPAPGI
ncbi:TetR/AcrR family transcriptional regulator [Bradyrhizobium liaoningense]|uniref:TetR/AcrR family transcriptional regulator n=2 Tax=Bradyrhizobium liaoningense TaxID=43992 RepID=UPI001BAAD505|nr:TetR/AcrR family transcriptional regulator [Bradyrhizobium liaoningense]MBR0840679.1 TetR/AcrR family transcriptional regulator [Bradyrhizobium liaoningense]